MEIKEIKDKILETGNVTSCAVMIVEKDGDIAEYVITDPTKTIVTLAELVEIASIISLRYGIVDYNKKLGGLQMTMDVFRNHLTITAEVGEKFLVTVVPNTVKMEIVNVIQDIKNILILKLGR
jgi:hypothetical protein